MPLQLASPHRLKFGFLLKAVPRDAILESIAGAKKEIHVGAYKLEDKIIAQALVDAKDRGVEVSIILDKKKKQIQDQS